MAGLIFKSKKVNIRYVYHLRINYDLIPVRWAIIENYLQLKKMFSKEKLILCQILDLNL